MATLRLLEMPDKLFHSASYDCQFVALAEDEAIELVTFDQQILKAFPSVAAPPESV
jgi:predicted nucleic acid-binding protein